MKKKTVLNLCIAWVRQYQEHAVELKCLTYKKDRDKSKGEQEREKKIHFIGVG